MYYRGRLTEAGLRSLLDHRVHGLIRASRHGPGVVLLNNVLHAVAVHENVVDEANTLSHGNQIQVIGEKVDVDVGLLEGVRRVERDGAAPREGTQQIDNDGHVIALGGRGDVPLEGVAEHGHKVNLEVRLAAGTKGVDAAIGLLEGNVLGRLLEVLVDAREADELEETAGQGPLVLPAVRRGSGILLQTGPEEVVLEAKAVLELEDVGEDGVIEEVLADVLRLDHGVDAKLGQLGLGADAGEHQQLGGLVDAERDNDLMLRAERVDLAVGPDDLDANGLCALKDELLGVGLAQDGDVGLALEEAPAGGALAVVDGIDALPETEHGAVVDVVSQGLALADPGTGEGIAEAFRFGEHVGVRDGERPVLSDVLELGTVLAAVIVVGGGLSYVRRSTRGVCQMRLAL